MNALSKAAVVALGLIGSGLPVGTALAADPAPPAAAEPGVWQKHQYSFNFMGFTSTYSCDGLADKLKLLLIAAGARKDAKSVEGPCAAPYGRPDKFARADLTFYSLVPAATFTPARDAKPGDTAPGTGVWRQVVFTEYSPRDLQVGDCELIEQFRDHVLPLLTTRNVVSQTTCIPHQNSGSVINLRFEVFAAAPGLPEVAPAAAPAPAIGPAATAAPGPSGTLYAYPAKGQSREQQAKDRGECNASAAAQTGFDPAAAVSADAATRRAAFDRAVADCLGARGYSVR